MKMKDRNNLKNSIIKLYGNLHDMEWSETEKKLIPKSKVFLSDSTQKFICIINFMQMLSGIVRIVFGKNYYALFPFFSSAVSVVLLSFSKKKLEVHKIIKFEVASLIFFVIGIVLLVIF